MLEIAYFLDSSGHAPVLDYLVGLERHGEPAAVGSFWRRLESIRVRGTRRAMPYARLIDPAYGLYELRFGAHRSAYVEEEGTIVLLHAWRKQTQGLDIRHAGRAIENLRVWRSERGGGIQHEH